MKSEEWAITRIRISTHEFRVWRMIGRRKREKEREDAMMVLPVRAGEWCR